MLTLSSRYLPWHLLVVAAVLLVAAAGCSRGVKKVTISGTVSYRGQPVTSGILRFVGPDGAYSAASIQPDGTFIITDVVPGEVKVGVMEAPQGAGSSSDPKKGSSGARAAPVSLPAKYRDPESSGVKYTITPQTEALDIAIK